MSVNKVILVGHVGKDPEIRILSEGSKVANFTIATIEKGFTNKDGKVYPDLTEWHNIVAWKGLAELSEKWIKKGSQLYIDGKIRTRSWEKDGVKHYTTEIIAETIQMVGGKKEEGQATKAEPMPTAPPTEGHCPTHGEDDGSGLPF